MSSKRKISINEKTILLGHIDQLMTDGFTYGKISKAVGTVPTEATIRGWSKDGRLPKRIHMEKILRIR